MEHNHEHDSSHDEHHHHDEQHVHSDSCNHGTSNESHEDNHDHAHNEHTTSYDTTGFIDITGDDGILKKITKESTSDVFPETGMEVIAHYTGTLDDGSKFDSSRDRGKEFKFTIGKGQVIKGWDQGFATMKKGEKAILRCRSDYAYGDSGQGAIPPGATLNFDVELIDFHLKKKESWEMSDEEKITETTVGKEQGTVLFKEKRYEEASMKYQEAADVVENMLESGGSSQPEAEAVWISCKLNAAQCAINLSEYPQAIAFTNAVLKRDAYNVKALYRRGVARNQIGLADEALADLNLALTLDSENKAVMTELNKSKKLIADAKKKEKNSLWKYV